MRRFHTEWRDEVSGIELRAVRGHKAPDDLRLEWWIEGSGWRAVEMRAAAIMCDFFAENEDVLYPPPARGKNYFLGYIHDATNRGYFDADLKLKREKSAKQTRQAS
jgi:hypothetical protein